MTLNHDACYQAVKAKDARFDGIFYTAVKTTGIYCRPICKAPLPKSENCTFFSSPAEAETHGYRPCLRCRPEMAPEYSDFRQSETLFRLILSCFDEQRYTPGSVGRCADALGISSRHLHRVFKDNTGLSPNAYIMTKRLLNAKTLLTDTTIPLDAVSELSGFGSTSRFFSAFKKQYHLSPNTLRSSADQPRPSFFDFTLYYRPPYDWPFMLQFLKYRAIPGVEAVTEAGTYRRSVRLEKKGVMHYGWIEVSPFPSSNKIKVSVSRSLQNVIFDVLKRVKGVFDLTADPSALPPGLSPGIRLPGAFDGFEMAVRAILGQQITVKAATTLAGRFAGTFGHPAETPFDDITQYFPTPSECLRFGSDSQEQLGSLGIIRTRSQTLLTLSEKTASGELLFRDAVNIADFKAKLKSIKGIGEWTADYITMRALRFPDVFLIEDIGVKNALMPLLISTKGDASPDLTSKKHYKAAAASFSERFRPWRSYLTLSLWKGDCNDLLSTDSTQMG
jgi:AraC family transcriptional regulator of adaptative response / DNA-3-methyladenine glycosylase II